MEEIGILLATEEIELWAPPAEIQLVVGIGAQGPRGSKIWSGLGSPSAFFAATSETALIGDMYIDSEAKGMYELIESPTGAVWSFMFFFNGEVAV